ncbi:NAD(P)H-dependent oxidoreductase [Sphingomonas fennica]|jgi:hypothetical protein|uniref:NAD(P)H-dependent oxidoreductase n=1 Tax=Edaphosphingomonas fennica TaxID=114404 RepID=UPI001FE60258|nr:NAD(P)H-dependent oxidoreductase [Sphingomonas fennica]
MARIAIIDGHPDTDRARFVHALADAYAAGAEAGIHEVRRIDIASLDFPILRSAKEWREADPADTIHKAQIDIRWADHLVILYPLSLFDHRRRRKGWRTPETLAAPHPPAWPGRAIALVRKLPANPKLSAIA